MRIASCFKFGRKSDFSMNLSAKISAVAIATIIAFAPLVLNVNTPAFAQEESDFITNAEFIKGHLEQAVANKESGNIELAIAHAGHPIEEVFTLMEEPLSDANPQLAADLKAKLTALPNAANSDTSLAFEQKVTEIVDLIDEAVEAVAGEDIEVATVVVVISNLLETAEHEYEEGVENGQIKEMIEYQDASAFISRANALFETVKADIDEHEAEEIEGFLEQLVNSVNAKADPSDIETLVSGIMHEFEEAVPSGAENENVKFAANIEFIKGHLAQAMANKQAGSVELAIAHSGHPIEEVFSLIEEELAEHDEALSTQLKSSLTALGNQANTLSASDFQSKVAEINEMLDKAYTSVIEQEERSDPKFNALVVITLLETAEHEYEEAVEGGKIVEMIEYQDSTAFIARAEAVFDSFKAQVPSHEAEETEEFFEHLNSLTKANAGLEEVEIVIGGIVHELEEALGLEEEEEETELGGWEYIARINDLLDEAAEEYEEGNAQRAKALAVEAYLENYENIESDIKADDPELMEKIEIDMRVNLVKMIDDGRPVDEVKAHISMIKTDLQTAKAVVTPEFPVTMAIIVVVMASVVAMARFRGSIFRPSV